MELIAKVPLPLEPIRSNQVEDRRLWVGNLDLRINDSTYYSTDQDHKPVNQEDMHLLLTRQYKMQKQQKRLYIT